MNTVFVLMMVVSGLKTGVASINQEFSTLERCEVARKAIEAQVTKRRGPEDLGWHGYILASTCQQK